MNIPGSGRLGVVLSCAALVSLSVAAGQPADPNKPSQPAPTQPARPSRGTPPPAPKPAPTAPNSPSNPGTNLPTPPQQPQQTPANPGTTTNKPAPKMEPAREGPYIKRERLRDMTLRIFVRVNSDTPNQKIRYRDPFSGKTVDMPDVTPFHFATLGVVFPLIPQSATSVLNDKQVMGKLTLNDTVIDADPTILKGYPGGTELARFDFAAPDKTVECRQVQLELELTVKCARTTFDEPGAMKVGWPTGPWPPEAGTMLQPQLYVEMGFDSNGVSHPYDDKLLVEALKTWLSQDGASKPRDLSPVALAKMIVSHVWNEVQLSGDGLEYVRTGEVAGLDVNPPAFTLRDRRGSEIDANALLVAMMRKAGLPARVVFGYDVSSGDDKFLKRNNRENRLRTWVEFCVFDEKANTINWVPVDLVKLRKLSSRAMPVNRPWKFFGLHDEMDRIVPFSFHFHPPTDVVAYGWPAFWGWFVTPQTPKAAEQAIRFDAFPAAKRGDDPPPGQGEDSKDTKKPVKKGY